MADDATRILSSAEQMQLNHELYKDKFVDSSDDIINQETFLKLLMAEMSNQDPLEPTSNSEFISQLAQFSSMQYMLDSSKYAESNYAAGLVGKYVTAIKQEGKDAVTKSGIVEKVHKAADNSYLVTVDGEDFTLSQISSVMPAPDSGSGSVLEGGSNSLGDRISRAASMIGMFATVEPSDNGVTVAGFIDAIKVKDNKIYVVINTQEYEIDKLKEVTYAYYDDGSQGGETTDPSDKVEGEDGETVDPSEKVEGEDGDQGDQDADGEVEGDDVQSTAVGAGM